MYLTMATGGVNMVRKSLKTAFIPEVTTGAPTTTVG
ncbi:hypothetical protein LINPERHAP1_LOCUS32487 [Linum perenne]